MEGTIIGEKYSYIGKETFYYRNIYFRYREYRFDTIEENEEFDDSVFSSSEKTILDSMIKKICCYSGKVLEGLTHSETSWLLTRGELSPISIRPNY